MSDARAARGIGDPPFASRSLVVAINRSASGMAWASISAGDLSENSVPACA